MKKIPRFLIYLTWWDEDDVGECDWKPWTPGKVFCEHSGFSAEQCEEHADVDPSEEIRCEWDDEESEEGKCYWDSGESYV